MANGERRIFRAQSGPRWAWLYFVVFWVLLAWSSRQSARVISALDWLGLTLPLVSVVFLLVYLRQATTMSWDGVTVRSVLSTKRYGWPNAYRFEPRERSFIGWWPQTRAALRLTDGTLVWLTPRWSGDREFQLVHEMHAAAVWFRDPQNRFALQEWMQEHPPTFHPMLAGRPVGPLLVGAGLSSLAFAAAFPFPVVHPHRKLDSLHQLASTAPHHLAHATGWIEAVAILGVAAGLIGLLVAVRNVRRMSEPLPFQQNSGPRPTVAKDATVAAVAVAGAVVLVAAPVWFWVLVQGLPPQLGVLAVGGFAAIGVFALGMAAHLATRGRSRGERFTLRGYWQWRHALQ